MEKKEVLEKVSSKKALIGEMEKSKYNSGNLIALIVAGVFAVAFIIVECALGHFAGAMAVATICYTWACIQYICQYVIAHRPWQVLIGAVLDGLAAIAALVFYILFCVGVL